jgi:hypothetical protein
MRVAVQTVAIESCHCYCMLSSSLFVILVHMMLRLPTHEVTREREQDRIHRSPGDQDSEVEADAGMQIEEDLFASFYDVVERPCVAEVVEARSCGFIS